MKDLSIIAACGNDCAACPRHLPKSEAQLRRAAELWHDIGYRDRVVSCAEIGCTGCKVENWCRYDIVNCAAQRGVATCGGCPDYPCTKLQSCFDATEGFRSGCLSACDAAEWRALERAFFQKRRNLDALRRTIETDRMILRPLAVADAEDAFEWQSDPAVNRYMIYPRYTDIEKTREWIRGLAPDENEFGFALKSTGKVIGSGGIKYASREGVWELGYNLNRQYWGRGYATEASRALIRWAYDTQNARDFTAAHASANAASGRVIQKCGFVFERYGHYSRYDGSETFDACFYRLHLD